MASATRATICAARRAGRPLDILPPGSRVKIDEIEYPDAELLAAP